MGTFFTGVLISRGLAFHGTLSRYRLFSLWVYEPLGLVRARHVASAARARVTWRNRPPLLWVLLLADDRRCGRRAKPGRNPPYDTNCAHRLNWKLNANNAIGAASVTPPTDRRGWTSPRFDQSEQSAGKLKRRLKRDSSDKINPVPYSAVVHSRYIRLFLHATHELRIALYSNSFPSYYRRINNEMEIPFISILSAFFTLKSSNAKIVAK